MPIANSSLAVTATAAAVIREIVAGRASPTGSGLRLTSTDSPPGALLLSVARSPSPGDSVLLLEGTRLFIDVAVADSVAGRVMDVEVNPQGIALFSLDAAAVE